ncbi:MAG: HEAT repeat domain-containing protein [Elusimicrobiota bacterium]|jgi:HEAT repeat protein
MLLKPCPFCQKSIPRAITVCPYCHRNEQGQSVQVDSSANELKAAGGKLFENDLAELSSDDPFIREQAVVRMAQKGFGVVQALTSILSDLAKPGLASVAKVLGRVGDRRSIPVLIQAAKFGDDDLRTAAVWALTQFREPEILPALLSEVERPHPTIQSYLAYVLGSYQDSRVIPVLAKLARHSSREVAFHAAYALGETGDQEAIPALRRAARRRDAMVRQAASASLRRLGARPTEPGRMALYLVAFLVVAGILAGVYFQMF